MGYVAWMSSITPKPDLDVMRRVEELLREQLEAIGEDPDLIAPHEISLNMQCAVYKTGALAYTWKGRPLLDVDPEVLPSGAVRWRFIARDTPLQ
jgi:hypothetical protein